MDFLHHYEAISRQFQAKSNFYIGGSASASHQDIVHSVTGFQWHQLSFIYLRCLVFTEHLKISLFNDMVQKVRDRIYGWANQLLSFGRKLVLMHHMLSFVPLHLFHALCSPVAVIKCLES